MRFWCLFVSKKMPNNAVTLQRQSQFTPKMKANADSRLLSSLVWIDQYNEYTSPVASQHCLASFWRQTNIKISPDLATWLQTNIEISQSLGVLAYGIFTASSSQHPYSISESWQSLAWDRGTHFVSLASDESLLGPAVPSEGWGGVPLHHFKFITLWGWGFSYS